MRWLSLIGISLFVLILLFAQYQENEQALPALTKSVLQGATSLSPIVSNRDHTYLDVSVPRLDTAQGWLQPDLKLVFDHFLLRYEQDESELWQAFDRYCTPLTYCAQISELLQRYIDFKKALVAIDDNQANTLSAIELRLDNLSQMRHAFFSGHEIDVLFPDASHQHSALQRLTIMQDPQLEPNEKQQWLDQYYSQLKPSELKAIQPSLHLQRISKLSEGKALQTEDYNILAAEFGHDAAERLLKSAEQQRHWQRRLTTYQERLTELSQQLEGDELERATNELQRALFNDNELKRVKAILG